eukprot:CAMPEP_0201571620 /NCGR_PEP_ID=MMETSP0190_2-20130828/14494_1 /ASSEMBLY_ACC=CAM_ASM_000263 /TAXON_ID=37353 /ORGANISM="Rosalina sp." /LENGTH=85 /DNA_ID=CAMNT_0047996457 /DNA_START=58 /DNA_END=315 /DNA_ORIENTATION=-
MADDSAPMPLDPGYLEVSKGLKIAGIGLLLFVLINFVAIIWLKCTRKKNNIREKGVDELSADTDDEIIPEDVANANESEMAPINE